MQSSNEAKYLRLLARDELMLGQVLPGHLCDQTGRILIRRGERLTARHLQMLDNREQRDLYVGRDWPSANGREAATHVVTPAELVEALKRRNRSRGQHSRGRRHARHEWRTRLHVTVQECSKGMFRRREIEVTTCDLSASGFAFVSQQFIHPGTILYPRFEALPNRPTLKAVVRNCVYVTGREHRVGAEFVHLDPGESVPQS